MGGRGLPKTGGRIKGVPNKRTLEFRERVAELGFDPAQAMVEIYREAKKIYDAYGQILDRMNEAREIAGNPFPAEDKSHLYLKIAGDMAKEIASYTTPKLKSIEHVKPPSPLDNMSPEQRLEAMREAVKALEIQVKTIK